MKVALLLTALCAIAALTFGAPTLPEGLVRTPSGIFPAECVHSVPSGATLERSPTTDRLHVRLADGTLHAILPKCEHGARKSLPSDYDGWEACVRPLLPLCQFIYVNSLPIAALCVFIQGNISFPATLLITIHKTRLSTLFWDTFLCLTSPRKFLMQDGPSSRTDSNIPSLTFPKVLYIFTGLQNFDWIPRHDPERQSSGFDIIQPVLQASAPFIPHALPG